MQSNRYVQRMTKKQKIEKITAPHTKRKRVRHSKIDTSNDITLRQIIFIISKFLLNFISVYFFYLYLRDNNNFNLILIALALSMIGAILKVED